MTGLMEAKVALIDLDDQILQPHGSARDENRFHSNATVARNPLEMCLPASQRTAPLRFGRPDI